MKYSTQQQVKLIEAIRLGDLSSLDNILELHPELINNITCDLDTNSPMTLALEAALSNLEAIKKLVNHGAKLSAYKNILNNNLISQALEYECLSREMFEYILMQSINELPISKIDDFLLNTFALLIQYGNYPQCQGHIEILFKQGLNTANFSLQNFSQDCQEHNKHFPHIKFILADIINDFASQYPNHTANLSELFEVMLPKDGDIQKLTYADVIDYLQQDQSPADNVLMRFIDILTDTTTLYKIYKANQLLQGYAGIKIIAKIYDTLKLHDKDKQCHEIVEHILNFYEPIDKIIFLIDVVTNQSKRQDTRMHVIDLIGIILESIKNQDLRFCKHQEEIYKLLDILIIYDLHKDLERITQRVIKRLDLLNRLDAAIILFSPEVSITSFIPPKTPKDLFLARKKIANEIIVRVKYDDINEYFKEQAFYTTSNSPQLLSINFINAYYKIGWFVSGFNSTIIQLLINNIDIPRAITIIDNNLPIILANLFYSLLQLEHHRKCAQIVTAIKDSHPDFQLRFAITFLGYLNKVMSALTAMNQKIMLMEIVKKLILEHHTNYQYHHAVSLYKTASLGSIMKIERKMYREFNAYYITGQNQLIPKNLSELMATALGQVESICKGIHDELLIACLHRYHAMLNTILTQALRQMHKQKISNDLNLAINTAQKFVQEYNEHLRVLFDKLINLANCSINVNKTITLLTTIIYRLMQYTYKNIMHANIAQQKTILETSLALTLTLPDSYHSMQIDSLRVLLTIELAKFTNKTTTEECPLIKRVREDKTFTTYFSILKNTLNHLVLATASYTPCDKKLR
jgi:hypothetical protein